MLRRRAAAATEDVHQTRASELTQRVAHGGGGLVVLAESVRQTRVRMGADIRTRRSAQRLHIGTKLFGAQSTIQAHAQRFGVAHRLPERFAGLSRQGPAAGVGNGSGNHQRGPVAEFPLQQVHGVDGGLGIQCVEYGLEQDDVCSTIEQGPCGREVVVAQLGERHRTKAGIVHVWRQAGGAVCGSQHTRHESWRAVPSSFIRRRPGDAGCGMVNVLGTLRQRIISLGDGRGGKRIGLDDIGAGGEVAAVSLGYYIGLRQAQHVVIAFQRR